MFKSDFLIKVRPYFAVAILLISFVPVQILNAIYRLIDVFVLCRRFKSIEGNVAVVTGAGHGLGRCIAVELGKRGCHVAVIDINMEGAKETERIVSSQFEGKCKAYKVDVTNYEDIVKLNERISRDLGVATILFNNAGILTVSSFTSPTVEEIQRMISVNLTSHFLMNRVFLENMKKKGKGHIVAICSIAGIFPIIYNSLYCATKFGVRGMMRTLRLELDANDFGDIRTTLAMPSFLSTNKQVIDFANMAKVVQFYPLISGEEAAQKIVHAMLKNKKEIVLPRVFGIFSLSFELLPAAWQDKLYCLVAKPFLGKFKKIYKEKLEKVDTT